MLDDFVWFLGMRSAKIDQRHAADDQHDAHDLDPGHRVIEHHHTDDRDGCRANPGPNGVDHADLQMFKRLDHCEEAQNVEDCHQGCRPRS